MLNFENKYQSEVLTLKNMGRQTHETYSLKDSTTMWTTELKLFALIYAAFCLNEHF